MIFGPVAQLVRAPPCHGGGREFESLLGRCGVLAQLGEHLPYKQGVTGSSPVGPILFYNQICRSGGTGRRTGLKILRGLNFVRVRFPSAAGTKSCTIDRDCAAFLQPFFIPDRFIVEGPSKRKKRTVQAEV